MQEPITYVGVVRHAGTASQIIANVAADLEGAINRLFPEAIGEDSATADPGGASPDESDAILGVDIEAAVFLEVNKPSPVIPYEMAKGWLTGERPDVGEMHTLKEPHLGR